MTICKNCEHAIIKFNNIWFHGYDWGSHGTSCICEGCTKAEPKEVTK